MWLGVLIVARAGSIAHGEGDALSVQAKALQHARYTLRAPNPGSTGQPLQDGRIPSSSFRLVRQWPVGPQRGGWFHGRAPDHVAPDTVLPCADHRLLHVH